MKPHTLIRHLVVAVAAVSGSVFAPVVLAGATIPCTTGCTAPTVTGGGGPGEADTTQAYAGINWAFGAGPELVVGVRGVHNNARNKVAGAKIEATFPFGKQTITFDKLRLRLVGGNRVGMYELGGGYSFASKGFLLSGALQADYVTAGTDLTLGTLQWQPFVGINTLVRPDEGKGGTPGTLTCPTGWELHDAAWLASPGNLSATPDKFVNGLTCVQPA
ncbi:MAG: hypothetical protein ACM3VZ_05555 [Acidobacteriota bacterium]